MYHVLCTVVVCLLGTAQSLPASLITGGPTGARFCSAAIVARSKTQFVMVHPDATSNKCTNAINAFFEDLTGKEIPEGVSHCGDGTHRAVVYERDKHWESTAINNVAFPDTVIDNLLLLYDEDSDAGVDTYVRFHCDNWCRGYLPSWIQIEAEDFAGDGVTAGTLNVTHLPCLVSSGLQMRYGQGNYARLVLINYAIDQVGYEADNRFFIHNSYLLPGHSSEIQPIASDPGDAAHTLVDPDTFSDDPTSPDAYVNAPFARIEATTLVTYDNAVYNGKVMDRFLQCKPNINTLFGPTLHTPECIENGINQAVGNSIYGGSNVQTRVDLPPDENGVKGYYGLFDSCIEDGTVLKTTAIDFDTGTDHRIIAQGDLVYIMGRPDPATDDAGTVVYVPVHKPFHTDATKGPVLQQHSSPACIASGATPGAAEGWLLVCDVTIHTFEESFFTSIANCPQHSRIAELTFVRNPASTSFAPVTFLDPVSGAVLGTIDPMDISSTDAVPLGHYLRGPSRSKSMHRYGTDSAAVQMEAVADTVDILLRLYGLSNTGSSDIKFCPYSPGWLVNCDIQMDTITPPTEPLGTTVPKVTYNYIKLPWALCANVPINVEDQFHSRDTTEFVAPVVTITNVPIVRGDSGNYQLVFDPDATASDRHVITTEHNTELGTIPINPDLYLGRTGKTCLDQSNPGVGSVSYTYTEDQLNDPSFDIPSGSAYVTSCNPPNEEGYSFALLGDIRLESSVTAGVTFSYHDLWVDVSAGQSATRLTDGSLATLGATTASPPVLSGESCGLCVTIGNTYDGDAAGAQEILLVPAFDDFGGSDCTDCYLTLPNAGFLGNIRITVILNQLPVNTVALTVATQVVSDEDALSVVVVLIGTGTTLLFFGLAYAYFTSKAGQRMVANVSYRLTTLRHKIFTRTKHMVITASSGAEKKKQQQESILPTKNKTTRRRSARIPLDKLQAGD